MTDFQDQEQRAAEECGAEYERCHKKDADDIESAFVMGSTWRGQHGPERKETECLRKALEVARAALKVFASYFGEPCEEQARETLQELDRILGEK